MINAMKAGVNLNFIATGYQSDYLSDCCAVACTTYWLGAL